MQRAYRLWFHPQRCGVTLGAEWLLIAPLGVWGIGALWIPLTTPALDPLASWIAALAAALLLAGSLAGHVLAHWLAARLTGGAVPVLAPLYLFGDAAQSWPTAPTPWRETAGALAGPAANLLFAGAAYLVWDVQLLPAFDAGTLLVMFFNLALAAINLAPGIPFDGARLARAVVWGLLRSPDRGARLAIWMGRLFVVGLAAWGGVLLTLQARFSSETGVGTLLVAALPLLAIWRQPRMEPRLAPADRRPWSFGRAARALAAGLLIVVLAGAALSMVPLVQGIYAPGLALPIEPMIVIAPEHRHSPSGAFLLTTVTTQTPIVLGQWVEALVDPSVEIVPAEQVVPRSTTPQEQVRQYADMLEESESVAMVVGLRLAGFQASATSAAAEVVSILPESAARGALEPGDWIVGVNGAPVTSATELIGQIAAQRGRAAVELAIKRGGQARRLTVPLLPPAEPDGPPRIGVTVQSIGYTVDLPFPVRIEPHKIGGGPSAGLMFALTTYNLVTPEDLTRGHRIAGTGTIALDGTVGPIGGVAQKVVAAERAGAEYFLVPRANYASAQRAARRITVVPVANVQEAITFLRRL